MKMYHVFTNNRDDWIENKKEAIEQYKEWFEEFGTARLYEEIRKNGEIVEENCIMSEGEWPL